jgi:hypothetical protein
VVAALLGDGLIEDWPMVLGKSTRGERYRGSSPSTAGAIVWERSTWSDEAVRAIVSAAIADLRANAPDLPDNGPPSLVPWSDPAVAAILDPALLA